MTTPPTIAQVQALIEAADAAIEANMRLAHYADDAPASLEAQAHHAVTDWRAIRNAMRVEPEGVEQFDLPLDYKRDLDAAHARGWDDALTEAERVILAAAPPVGAGMDPVTGDEEHEMAAYVEGFHVAYAAVVELRANANADEEVEG